MSGSGRPFTVRRGNLSDLEVIIQFNAAMAWETEGKELDPDRLRDGVSAVLLAKDLGFYLVAETGGKVVGQLLVTSEWSDWRNGFFWWIQSVYVHPDHRRQGVYRALYESLIRQAQEGGNACGVRLYVERSNQTAQAAYSRLGMSQSHYDMYETEF